MTVISVTATDSGDSERLWAVPPDAALNKTPIPRGIRHYEGTVAVAALGASDQTNVQVAFSFPSQFLYVPKAISIWFESDDATCEFTQYGLLKYIGGGSPDYLLDSGTGLAFNGVDNFAQKIYRPLGSWRQWLDPAGNGLGPTNMHLVITDQSGDTSTAGDVFWSCDYWIYDIEQCMNYPVNLFEQIIPYP